MDKKKINIDFSFIELWTLVDMVKDQLCHQNSYIRERSELLLKLEHRLEEFNKK